MPFCQVCGTVTHGKCPKCVILKVGRSRHARGYDSKWVKLRDQFLKENPVCVDCAYPKVRPAIEVHHIQTILAAPHLRLVKSNLAPLCIGCHKARHQKEKEYAG